MLESRAQDRSFFLASPPFASLSVNKDSSAGPLAFGKAKTGSVPVCFSSAAGGTLASFRKPLSRIIPTEEKQNKKCLPACKRLR